MLWSDPEAVCIPGVFEEAKKLGLPPLEIIEIGMRVRFIVPLLEPVVLQTRGVVQPGVELGVESGVESKMAMRIFVMLEKTPLSKAEIARKLGKKKPTRYLNDLMKKFIVAKHVVYTIPDKPNSRSGLGSDQYRG